MLWCFMNVFVKFFEFLSCVVLWVGLNIFRLCVWNRLMMLVVSGVFGLMSVNVMFLCFVKLVSLLSDVMLMFFRCLFCVVLLLLGVM